MEHLVQANNQVDSIHFVLILNFERVVDLQLRMALLCKNERLINAVIRNVQVAKVLTQAAITKKLSTHA